MSALFTLRVRMNGEPMIVIRAWEMGFQHPNHTRLDVEVRQGSKIIFDKGSLYCGVSSMHSIDGDAAKELVMSLVAMRPGDTDREYFDSYTPEQLDWATAHGELLSMIADDRYSART